MDKSEFELHFKIEDLHWWFKARRAILLDVLKRFVRPGSGKTLAEIGCGTGGIFSFAGVVALAQGR